jgi:phosphotriesterase-related protein
MLSHDTVWYFLGKSPFDLRPTHLFKNIIPDLKQAGINEDKIKTILIDNPRRLFAGV